MLRYLLHGLLDGHIATLVLRLKTSQPHKTVHLKLAKKLMFNITEGKYREHGSPLLLSTRGQTSRQTSTARPVLIKSQEEALQLLQLHLRVCVCVSSQFRCHNEQERAVSRGLCGASTFPIRLFMSVNDVQDRLHLCGMAGQFASGSHIEAAIDRTFTEVMCERPCCPSEDQTAKLG